MFFDILFLLFCGFVLWLLYKGLVLRSNLVHWFRRKKKEPIYITLKNGVQYKMKVTLVKRPEWSAFKNDKDFEIILLRRFGIFPLRFWFNGFGPTSYIPLHHYMYEDGKLQELFGNKLEDFIIAWAKAMGNAQLDTPFFKKPVPKTKSETDILLEKFK